MIGLEPRAAPAPSPWRVPLSSFEVDDELLTAATGALASGWWSTGPRVEAFEGAFAGFLGTRHAVACSSGTAALHLALLAAGVGPGDEVVMPSLNFVAAANLARLMGARPVFCDVLGPHDLNLDPASLAAAVTRRTRALVVLHYGGFPCDMDAVLEIAAAAGVPVIEDAAHAPGATWRGARCGALGHIGCFSFFANKNLPVGEGGMVVTGDEEIGARLRRLRSHGMERLSWDRHKGHAGLYDIAAPGLNLRFDELRAAIGLVQLERLPAENAGRERIVRRYRAALAGEPAVEIPFALDSGPGTGAHHLAVVLVPAGHRDAVREALAAAGIQTSVHYPPAHAFTAHRDPAVRLPRTEAVAERMVSLPLYGAMTGEQADAVVEALRAALPRGKATASRK